MAAPRIQEYRFKRMVVDGEEHTQDLVLLPDRVVTNWWRKDGHRLGAADLAEVLNAAPEALVVGTGAYGLMRVPEETRQAIEAANIQLHVARTGKAWQLYNDLQDRHRTAGAFHIAC